ncbi:MAG: NUDIX domain-containing protein [Bacilli bacterium]|nr:NUDIX domain-containing protein [Bacilli bacterium]
MKKEKSCGIIVFDNDKVLVVKHLDGHYGFPKGHVENNETEEETAIREVKEETNCDAKIIPGFREVITYSPKQNVIKDVVYFIGKPISIEIKPQESEISNVKFLSFEDILNVITFSDEKELFIEALNYYKTIN